ncbi:MAG: hypothetical protein GQ535_09900 [Rhodobacteraceae bacterium]|nr:hypothetical protein [Paracoccaceae bacterium]
MGKPEMKTAVLLWRARWALMVLAIIAGGQGASALETANALARAETAIAGFVENFETCEVTVSYNSLWAFDGVVLNSVQPIEGTDLEVEKYPSLVETQEFWVLFDKAPSTLAVCSVVPKGKFSAEAFAAIKLWHEGQMQHYVAEKGFTRFVGEFHSHYYNLGVFQCAGDGGILFMTMTLTPDGGLTYTVSNFATFGAPKNVCSSQSNMLMEN